MRIRRAGCLGLVVLGVVAVLALTANPALAGDGAAQDRPRAGPGDREPGPGPWGPRPGAWWQRGEQDGAGRVAWARGQIRDARHRAIARKVKELRAKAMCMKAAGNDEGAAEAMRWTQVLLAADRQGSGPADRPGRARKAGPGPRREGDHARPDRRRQRLHQARAGFEGPRVPPGARAGDPRVRHVREAVQHLRAAGLDVMAERVMKAAMDQMRGPGGPDRASGRRPGSGWRRGEGQGKGLARPPTDGDVGPWNRGPGRPKAWKGPRAGNAGGRGPGPMGRGVRQDDRCEGCPWCDGGGPRDAMRPDGPPRGPRMDGAKREKPDAPAARGGPDQAAAKPRKAERKDAEKAVRPGDDLGRIRAEMAALRRQIEELRRLVKQASEAR